MAGNSVGLGNFLRFPVQAVENGGGAFLIPYLVCFLLMGIPLLWVEWSMGRLGGSKGYHATPFMFQSFGKRKFWAYIGVFGIFTNIGVAAYYCYIETWTLSYAIHSVKGTFSGLSQQQTVNFFDSYNNFEIQAFGVPEALLVFIVCIFINSFVLSKGLKGIEAVAKIGMPLLILCGIFLSIKALTLGTSAASAEFPSANAWDGLNFLWTPELDSIWRPKIWLAAAGQIFFTLSVGMGTIHCFAAYLKERDDVALNAVSAGFTNEFIEVILGSLIVLPIAAGYLGLDWIKANMGFGVAFQTMPFLFQQWGAVVAPLAGVFWFGLLFFAGITSSLAMGTPWIGFMRDEFSWSQTKSAYSFGLITLLFGLPCVIFYSYGVFDEYDYWAGTVSLVIFALMEIILFAWVFGIDKGWSEINKGADITVPYFYKWVIKYITPTFLLLVFVGAILTPENNDWIHAFQNLFSGNGWALDHSSLISQIGQAELKSALSDAASSNEIEEIENKLWFSNLSRMLLLSLFLGISALVFIANNKRNKKL
jgi:SNF family Na+-dependent transporter